MSRYRYYEDKANSKVICATTYAGRVVKGYAKCSPEDSYDFERGKEIAKLRADVKVAEKRAKNAKAKLQEATAMFDKSARQFSNMCNYCADASAELRSAKEILAEFLNQS